MYCYCLGRNCLEQSVVWIVWMGRIHSQSMKDRIGASLHSRLRHNYSSCFHRLIRNSAVPVGLPCRAKNHLITRSTQWQHNGGDNDFHFYEKQTTSNNRPWKLYCFLINFHLHAFWNDASVRSFNHWLCILPIQTTHATPAQDNCVINNSNTLTRQALLSNLTKWPYRDITFDYIQLKPNSITLAGSKLVGDRFEAGRRGDVGLQTVPKAASGHRKRTVTDSGQLHGWRRPDTAAVGISDKLDVVGKIQWRQTMQASVDDVSVN